MSVEILVHFEGSKSSIAFDALPTYNTLRRAITSDITDGNPSFLIIGSTQRGTPIVISDQTSFIRALGPRTSMIVNVRIQPSEGEVVQPQQQPQSNTPTSNINNIQKSIPSGNNNIFATKNRKLHLNASLNNSRRVSPRRSMDSEKRNVEFARKFVNDALVDLLEYITETFPGM